MTKILLVEDDESVNRAVAFSLQKEGYEVSRAATLCEAKGRLRQSYPDILLCDINLPDGSGLALVKEARESGSAYIICLTALDQETDQVMGYGAGADDYITKPFSLSVLTLKLRAYLERCGGNSKNCFRSGDLTVQLDAMKLFRDKEEIPLSRNEWKLLCLLAENAGKILSKGQILECLFDVEGSFVNDNTVAVNINRLREKIEPDRTDPMYIKNVRGLGYVWSKECRWGL
ncbi:MAG: response regulator transcription factor [Lachnospiraceae bacterium]|uniref:response regulator transcription factor n=1 Tax=Parablautia sp. Marseille-Q6255 TaxID=3039593 RepID=UPI0024BC2061|nr:response regulator transcription factor [Parablautia sp. Marseille-Q6255]